MTTRLLDEQTWIQIHGSGTLRHAYELKTAYRDLYLHERVAFTFGGAFSFVPKSRISTGAVLAEADCHPFTEGCWNIRRRHAEGFPGDKWSGPLYLSVSKDSITEQGMGILLEKANGCKWIPEVYVVYAIVAPVKNGKYAGEVFCL